MRMQSPAPDLKAEMAGCEDTHLARHGAFGRVRKVRVGNSGLVAGKNLADILTRDEVRLTGWEQVHRGECLRRILACGSLARFFHGSRADGKPANWSMQASRVSQGEHVFAEFVMRSRRADASGVELSCCSRICQQSLSPRPTELSAVA